jgi:hypothetical protein
MTPIETGAVGHLNCDVITGGHCSSQSEATGEWTAGLCCNQMIVFFT